MEECSKILFSLIQLINVLEIHSEEKHSDPLPLTLMDFDTNPCSIGLFFDLLIYK